MRLFFNCYLPCLFASSVHVVDSLLTKPEEKDFQVVPNPHQDDVCFSNLDGFLEPYHLILTPMTTQPDTFQQVVYATIMSVPVPVYRMKQPARLSAAELEFSLILVKDLSSTGQTNIRVIEMDDLEIQKDSWFPGYYWNPIALHCPEETNNQFQHVGWKFTALDPNNTDNTNNLPHFYALMIKMKNNKHKGSAISLAGMRAPGWIMTKLLAREESSSDKTATC